MTDEADEGESSASEQEEEVKEAEVEDDPLFSSKRKAKCQLSSTTRWMHNASWSKWMWWKKRKQRRRQCGGSEREEEGCEARATDGRAGGERVSVHTFETPT